MAVGYGYIGLFLVVAILFALTTIVLPIALRFIKIIPHDPTAAKGTPFECGMETIGKTWVQFNFRYYLYALIFLVIDVLIVFLFPVKPRLLMPTAHGKRNTIRTSMTRKSRA